MDEGRHSSRFNTLGFPCQNKDRPERASDTHSWCFQSREYHWCNSGLAKPDGTNDGGVRPEVCARRRAPGGMRPEACARPSLVMIGSRYRSNQKKLVADAEDTFGQSEREPPAPPTDCAYGWVCRHVGPRACTVKNQPTNRTLYLRSNSSV